MERLIFPTEFKSVTDEGHVSGWASVYGNVDRQNDIVVPGALKSASGGTVPLLWQHRADSPLGLAKVSEAEKGLMFAADLVMSDPLAVKARDHMRAGSVKGVSIGFDIRDGGYRIRKDGVRELTDLALWEISVVTFAANPLATVTAVKSRADLEHVARDVLGLSKSKARKLAYAGWPAISGEDTEDDDERTLSKRQQHERAYLAQGCTPENAKWLALQSCPIGTDPADENYVDVAALAQQLQSTNSILRGTS